jgi:predicted transcriptional regulator
MEYEKPAIVGQIALITLLRKLKKYMSKEIVVIINDAALYEVVRGTSTSKNNDVLKMAVQTRKELSVFPNLVIKDVSNDKAELVKWKEAVLD